MRMGRLSLGCFAALLWAITACGGGSDGAGDTAGGPDASGADTVPDATPDQGGGGDAVNPPDATPDAAPDAAPPDAAPDGGNPTDAVHPPDAAPDAAPDGGGDVAPPPARQIVILHTNDMHAQLFGTSPVSDYSPLTVDDDATTGGYARLAAVLNGLRAEAGDTPVLLLDGGDFTMGTSFQALSQTESPELKLMDAMGYDATTIGNHEFEFGPEATANILGVGLGAAANIQVLAANLVFSADDPRDDTLEALFTAGTVKPYTVIETANGLRVGLFGLLGPNALRLAPEADPVTIAEPAEAAQAVVDTLRNVEGCDLVVALSHGGVRETQTAPPGDDETWPAEVTGLDVVISAHSHTRIDPPLVVGAALVVQAGEYGKNVGRLELTLNEDGTVDHEAAIAAYRHVPVDDTVMGDAAVAAQIEGFLPALNDAVFGLLGITWDTPVVESDFSLTIEGMQENNTGDLVADALRVASATALPDDPPLIAITAGGVLRAPMLAGQSGVFWAEDAYEVIPLGMGPDGDVGYPLVSFYLTGDEVRQGMEITTTGAALVGNTFFLQISGLRFEYDPAGRGFNRVLNIYLGNEVDGYSETPLDTDPENPALYRVVVSQYLADMIGTVTDVSYGLLEIVPKDAAGVPIPLETMADYRIDADAVAPGVQEIKEWQALIEYLMAMPDTDSNGIANLEARYAAPQGRIVPVTE